MPRRTKPNPRKLRNKLRNRYAASLSNPKFKQKVVKKKTAYKRKTKHKKMTDEENNNDEPTNTKEQGKVVSFLTRKNLTDTDQVTGNGDGFVKQGLEAFNESVVDSVGFLSIVFDKEQNPTFIWAGDADIVRWIGAIELAKHELFNSINIVSEYQE